MTKNRHVGTLQKWWEFCTYSKCAQKIFFGKILCSTHQKKCFYKLLGSFWKIEFLMENRQPRTLQKWWKFCTISNMLRIFFFGKILCSTHQKKFFYKLSGSFWKIEFLTENQQPRPLTKIVKTLYSLKICLENIFGKNYLFHSSKEAFLQNIRQFLKNWIFDGNSTDGTSQKWRKFCTISTYAKNFFWGQNSLFHSSKEVFLQNFRQFFGKLNFWPKIDTCRPYKNVENFVLSQNVLRKYFLTKSFVLLIKRSFSTKF